MCAINDQHTNSKLKSGSDCRSEALMHESHGLLCHADRHADAMSLAEHCCCLLKATHQQCRRVCVLQADATREELSSERKAHRITAANGERQAQAYSLALQQANADLNQLRLEIVQLDETQPAQHRGAARSFGRLGRSLCVTHLRPKTCQSSTATDTTWRVDQVRHLLLFTRPSNLPSSSEVVNKQFRDVMPTALPPVLIELPDDTTERITILISLYTTFWPPKVGVRTGLRPAVQLVGFMIRAAELQN